MSLLNRNSCVFPIRLVFQRVLQAGGSALKQNRSVHHSPVWRSPLIPIVVEQTVSFNVVDVGLMGSNST